MLTVRVPGLGRSRAIDSRSYIAGVPELPAELPVIGEASIHQFLPSFGCAPARIAPVRACTEEQRSSYLMIRRSDHNGATADHNGCPEKVVSRDTRPSSSPDRSDTAGSQQAKIRHQSVLSDRRRKRRQDRLTIFKATGADLTGVHCLLLPSKEDVTSVLDRKPQARYPPGRAASMQVRGDGVIVL